MFSSMPFISLLEEQSFPDVMIDSKLTPQDGREEVGGAQYHKTF